MLIFCGEKIKKKHKLYIYANLIHLSLSCLLIFLSQQKQYSLNRVKLQNTRNLLFIGSNHYVFKSEFTMEPFNIQKHTLFY